MLGYVYGMPKKLKSSARKSRRNKRIGVAAFVIVIIAISGVLAFVYSQPPSKSTPVVQGDVSLMVSWVDATNTPRTGNITIRLRDDKPLTSGNFKNIVEQGLYDGSTFHRVIEGFMIQGGKVDTTINPISDEIGSDNHNLNGTVAMANAGANTATSEFFINVADNSNLYDTFDTTYTVLGTVIQGMDTVMAISHVPVDDATSQSPAPLKPVTIISAEVLPSSGS